MNREAYLTQQFETRTKRFLDNHESFYRNPASMAMDPFKIADQLYYVGDKKVCIHLIETEEGLILIDSGYPCAVHLLVDSIWRLGFDPKNVRWILHSHGHFDHFGASEEFRIRYGTKLAISAAEAAALREYPQQALLEWSGDPLFRTPVFDKELEDGEIFQLGSMKIRCVLTPGHSAGVMSYFFEVMENGKTYLAGTFGGAGLGALSWSQIQYCCFPKEQPQIMLHSIERILDEPVSIQLGNHPANNFTLEKRAKQLAEGGNPFIDETEWKTFLSGMKQEVERIIIKNREEDKMLHEQFS